jgi:hypothetical protein
MISNGEMIQLKVVVLEKIPNFKIDYFSFEII